MQILDNLIIIFLHIACFVAGIALANYYNDKATREQKDALEKQYLRLISRSDADDPVKPYLAPSQYRAYPSGDTDGDAQPITQEFMDELRQNGRAKVSFRKSDVS